MPKTSVLPQIIDHHHEHHIPLPRSPVHKGDKNKESRMNTHRTHQTHQSTPLIKRQLEAAEKQFASARQTNKAVLSNEAWIPNEYRMKTLGRDISAATDNLQVIQKREISLAREMRRLLVSDLERAQTEERLDATHKQRCECCMQEFLYVNLPLKVSRKAILDIRTKWSGKLSSATVFGGPDPLEIEDETMEMQADGTMRSTSSPAKSKEQRAMEKKVKLLSSIPACYDEVGVCVFCAQFFQVQEEYRPSYLTITQTERKAAAREARRRELEYWDPLKMVEKDRVAQEQREQMALTKQQQMGELGAEGSGSEMAHSKSSKPGTCS